MSAAALPAARTPADDGPLPPVLAVLTLITGVVDALSYLGLGHVFVANMTGNVVFLAFAALGVAGFAPLPELAALGGFLVGALLGGRFAAAARHRAVLLWQTSFIKMGCALAALAVAAFAPAPYRDLPLTLVLATMMGLQNAVARKLAVPDLTTTVLTLTLTGIAADSRLAGGANVRLTRRIMSVVTMFVGALMGAALLRTLGMLAPLALVAAAYALAGAASVQHRASREAWAKV